MTDLHFLYTGYIKLRKAWKKFLNQYRALYFHMLLFFFMNVSLSSSSPPPPTLIHLWAGYFKLSLS